MILTLINVLGQLETSSISIICQIPADRSIIMLPFSWHQGEDPWSNYAATIADETQHRSQVKPPPQYPASDGCISDMNMSPECHPVFSHEKTGWHSSDIFSSLSWYIMHTLPLLHTHASSDMPMQVVCGGQLSTGSARAHEQLRAPAAVTRCAHAAATVCWSPLSPPSCC